MPIRAISINANAPSLRISLSVTINNTTHTLKALLDTGAQGNFINQETAEKLNIQATNLSTPIKVTNVDGTPNSQGKIYKSTKRNLQWLKQKFTSLHF